MFARSDASLFRNLTTLGQKAGVPRERLVALVLKELTDNGLDTGAATRVGELNDGWFFVEDDGPGIDGDDEKIAALFSFGRTLTSSKLFRLPTRGALGNGLRVVAGCVLASRGALRVWTHDRWLELQPQDNGTTLYKRLSRKAAKAGTRIEIKFGADLEDSDNPLAMAKIAILLRGEKHYKGKTSPWWYGSDDFFDLMTAASGTVDELLLGKMDGYKRGLVDWGKESARDITREDSKRLLILLRGETDQIKPERLGYIGDNFTDTHGYGRDKGTFALRDGGGEGSVLPYVVEAFAFRQDKEEGETSVRFFVNRTPVSAEVECYIRNATLTLYGCGLSEEVKIGRAPIRFLVNVQCPYMPITTDGKAPNFRPVCNEIVSAITKAARRARKSMPGAGREALSKKDVIINSLDEAIRVASGGGRHRFSLRQLFYKVRPFFQRATGTDELDYNHFASVITSYEQMIGRDIPKMYRDARGTLYHPHTGETIPLGTLNVEAYKRPEWTFNKVLYCEKEGFFPLLLDEKWAERHDCALLTSKGFASRAARDVIDLLGDSDEELLFFAIHDADGPGTKILEALQEATAARPARRVKIVDLGLNPWEAVEMDLEIERVDRKKGRVPVAEYVRKHRNDYGARGTDWEEWLQTQRVELNAMTSPEFLEWLDKKIAEHDQGKVIPPNNVLGQKLDEAAAKKMRDRVVEKILKETGAEKRIEEAIKKIDKPSAKMLRIDVSDALEDAPADLWSVPVEKIAEKCVKAVKL